jgi:hypothetical protein
LGYNISQTPSDGGLSDTAFKLITAIDLGLMASFVWILLKYKLKHIVAVSRSRDRPREARAAN